MRLRRKLLIFLIGFLGLAFISGIGFISLSFTLKEEIVILHTLNSFHKQDEGLKDAFISYISAVSRYMESGSPNLKTVIWKRGEDVRSILNEIERSRGSLETVQRIKREFRLLSEDVSRLLTLNPQDRSSVDLYGRILSIKKSIEDDIDRLHGESLRLIDSAIDKGRDIQRRIFINIIALFFGTLVVAILLLLMLRRSIDRPFRNLLDATERISRGELAYRFEPGEDEFGLLAKRFYEIIDRLRQKLQVSELLIDISRPSSAEESLRDFLREKVRRISQSLDLVCEVYILKKDGETFELVEYSGRGDGMPPVALLKYSSISFLKDSGILWTNDLEKHDELRDLYDGLHRSLIIAPLVFDAKLKGIILFRRRERDSFVKDDLYTAEVISHIIGAGIRNHELYSELHAGYERFRLLYEFGKSITLEVNIPSLLAKTSNELSRILGNNPVIIKIDVDGRSEIALSHPDSFSKEDLKSLEEGLPLDGPLSLKEDLFCFPLTGKGYRGFLAIRKPSITPEEIQLMEGFISFLLIDLDKAMAFEEIVKREREAEESRRRIEILCESVRGGIVTLDREFRILSINRFMEHWIPAPEGLIGRDAIDVFHDKAPICPHCVASATFETGEINFMSQKGIGFYSELTSYPVKNEMGEVREVIVFIQDISERVLYQEELIGLYREVMQTKEYLEGVIENTADAIVTTDLNGIVTSWNKGAERIYGYTAEEVLGRYLPFIPQGLHDIEREYTERIRRGEVLKDIETYRVRKDGTVIEVSLTLSPIKDAYGNVIGTSGISRDITEKKRYERELAKRNQELSRLFLISSAMRSTLELDRLLRMILTAVTMSDGLGFNRAILFLVDEERQVLKGAMGVGPSSPEEAWRVWSSLSMEKKTLEDLMREIETGPLRKDSLLDRLSLNIEIPLENDTVLTKAVKEKRIINVKDVREEPLSDPVLVEQLKTEAYAVVPLISRDKVIGLLWVDNLFNRKPITDDDIRFLTGFSNQVAQAIENARLFERVRLAESELENIFESISDMVYITTSDYTIKNINRAVLERLNKRCRDEGIDRVWRKEDVIGKKCYEVFHGMTRPYESCPHHKTVSEKKAFMEEFEDPYLKMTSFSSTSPLFDQSGEFLGTVHVVRDISELKRLRERLEAAERFAALGEVAAKVAHEIRNPLVSVGGFARRLEARLDGSLKEYASIITKEVMRLETILREILSFVRGMALSQEDTDINALLDEIVNLYREELRKRKIEIRRQYIKDLIIPVDSGRVREAVINILTNAIQAINMDGVITITTDKTDKEGVIIIKDNGPGIDERDLPNIFNPFYTTKPTGTGLGLSITKKIIEEHGGRIEVETKRGEGSSFIIYLPLKARQML